MKLLFLALSYLIFFVQCILFLGIYSGLVNASTLFDSNQIGAFFYVIGATSVFVLFIFSLLWMLRIFSPVRGIKDAVFLRLLTCIPLLASFLYYLGNGFREFSYFFGIYGLFVIGTLPLSLYIYFQMRTSRRLERANTADAVTGQLTDNE